jgi:hypothetical protein
MKMKLIAILVVVGLTIITSCKKATKGDTGPAGANGASGGFTHYLGESFNGGIIYYVYKGGDGVEHGLIVSLTESTALAWQTTGVLVNANRSWDGAYNTSLMTGSPAANYIATLGSGWYLPSIDELSKLYNNRYDVNKALNAGGNTLLSTIGFYWSSTEFDAITAHAFYFTFGHADARSKVSPYIIRGIRSF